MIWNDPDDISRKPALIDVIEPKDDAIALELDGFFGYSDGDEIYDSARS